jgi:hypothetical protein
MGLEEMGEAEAAIPEAGKLLAEKGLIRVEKRHSAAPHRRNSSR